MDDQKPAVACFSCDRTEFDVPLLRLRYSSKEIHICPQCLPALIHHIELLAEKLLQR